jgi:hypothetical protein
MTTRARNPITPIFGDDVGMVGMIVVIIGGARP